MHYVYVIQNEDQADEFYIGFSSDLKRRITEHQAGKKQVHKRPPMAVDLLRSLPPPGRRLNDVNVY